MFNILLQVVIFSSKFSYTASYLTVISYTYVPKLYTNMIDSRSYSDSKWQMLTKPNVLIVLSEYINLLQSKRRHETIIWEGCPILYQSTLLYFSLSML